MSGPRLFRAPGRLARATLLAAAAAGPAAGQSEPRLTARVSLTAEADSNLPLDVDDAPAAGLTGRAGFAWSDRGPRGGLLLEADVAARAFAGEGAEDTSTRDLTELAPDLALALDRETRRGRIALDLRAATTPLEFTDLDEGTVRRGDALQFLLAAGVEATRELSPDDGLRLSASASRRDLVDGDASGYAPSTRGEVGVGWTRALSPRLGGSLDSELSAFDVEGTAGAAGVRGTTLAVRAGGVWEATPRLSATGGIGPSLTWIDDGGSGDEDLSVGVSARLAVDWTPTSRDAWSLSFSQTVSPSNEGVVRSATRLGLGLSRALSPRLSADLALAAGLDQPLDEAATTAGGGVQAGRRIFVSAVPALAWTPTPEMELSVGYRLRFEDERNAGDAVSHNVFVTLSRAFGL